ncbi:MAG TPA: glycosyltransferase family 4 protein [Gammaproteobacteria bacterium]|nr:glycosyltransferase family 4 protein [Gammaproteobacteria bacterium]
MSVQPATPSDASAAHEPLNVLCVTLGGDRAESEIFIGLARRGCRVRICCAPHNRYVPLFEAAGIRVLRLAFRKRIDLAAIRKLRAELRAEHCDVLYLLHNRPVSNGLLAVRPFREVKVVVYRGIVGNVGFLSPTSWLRYLNPRIDRVVCVAEAIRRHFLGMRFLGRRLPPEKFVTVYKGHDLAWYAATPVELAELGIPSDAFVVGCVANMRPRKGIEVLVRAFAQLPSELPIYLLLIGRMQSSKLDAAIAANPNSARIRKLGFRPDAPALIGACDAAALPSLKREGLPRSIIEAMAYGIPAIVTDVGGSPELVVHGSSGLVVPPGDADALAAAVLELYRDPDLRARLGAEAKRRIAADFNAETTVDQTLHLFRELNGVRAT